MAVIVEPVDLATYQNEIIEMHRQRCRVFRDRMNWNVQVSGDLEIDEFDAASPTYVLVRNEHRDLVASARLLPTTGPYMLRNVFPSLLGDYQAPAELTAWETSRFAVDQTRITKETETLYGDTTSRLVSAIIEYALAIGVKDMLAATDLRVERVLRQAGLSMERFTSVRQVGGTRAVAVSIPMNERQLRRVQRYGDLEVPAVGATKERMFA